MLSAQCLGCWVAAGQRSNVALLAAAGAVLSEALALERQGHHWSSSVNHNKHQASHPHTPRPPQRPRQEACSSRGLPKRRKVEDATGCRAQGERRLAPCSYAAVARQAGVRDKPVAGSPQALC